MKARHEDTKKEKGAYEKPVLTRHGKLTGRPSFRSAIFRKCHFREPVRPATRYR